jgi:hypothetical protein
LDGVADGIRHADVGNGLTRNRDAVALAPHQKISPNSAMPSCRGHARSIAPRSADDFAARFPPPQKGSYRISPLCAPRCDRIEGQPCGAFRYREPSNGYHDHQTREWDAVGAVSAMT